MIFTHKGWFGACPVRIGNVSATRDLMAMHIEPRWWWVAWLAPVSLFVYKVARRIGYSRPFPIWIRRAP